MKKQREKKKKSRFYLLPEESPLSRSNIENSSGTRFNLKSCFTFTTATYAYERRGEPSNHFWARVIENRPDAGVHAEEMQYAARTMCASATSVSTRSGECARNARSRITTYRIPRGNRVVTAGPEIKCSG